MSTGRDRERELTARGRAAMEKLQRLRAADSRSITKADRVWLARIEAAAAEFLSRLPL